MNKTVKIDTAKLDRVLRGVVELVGEDVQNALHERLRAELQDPPITITLFDPLNDNATMPIVETMNKRELGAIYALIIFAGWHLNTKPATIEARVEAQFHVPHVARIPRDDFQNVVDYLVDIAERFDREID